MKAMRKIGAILLSLIAVLLIGGCYRVKPGTMKELKGTYKLTQYYRTYPATGSETGTDKVDFIEQKKIEAYLVIDGTDYGYTVYKDNETALLCNRVHFTYTYSQEDENAVELIEYTTAQSYETPIYETGKLGFHSGEKKLNQQLPHIVWENKSFVTKYTDYTEYTRVDKATDLSYATKKLGELPPCADYALAPYDGLFRIEDPSLTPYIYYIMEIDAVAGKANVYYALRSDGERVVLSDLTVGDTMNENTLTADTITVGDKQLLNSFAEGLHEEAKDAEGYTYYLHYVPLSGDMETFIEQALADSAADTPL